MRCRMKKLYILSVLLFILLTLSGCQMVTIDKQVKAIKEQVENGFSFEKVEKVHLTNQSFPELLVLTSSKEHTKVQIQQYNKESKEWKVVYEAKEHPHFNGLEQLEVIDVFKQTQTQLDHVFIGYHGGTGGFLNFYVLGSNEQGDIMELSNKMLNEHPNSHIKQTEKGFDLYSGEAVVESYLWNGHAYVLKK